MKRTQLKQFAVCLLTTALSISCTGELSIEVQDWIKLPDEEIELDIKNRVETVTVSSKVAWTAVSDVDWLAIEPSRGYAGETEVTITSTFEEDKETSGAIVFNSSQEGNFKETRLPVKHETLVADWITLPGKAVELDIKNNSKTVVVSSKVNWTAVSDADWLVFEPSSGKAGETEVKITSTLNEDKENSGTIMFSSSDAGNLKDIQLTVTQTTLITDWITLPEEAVELDIKNNSSTVAIISETAWTATSGVDWLTLEPSSGNAGTTEVKISSTLNKDVGSSGSITFNSSEEGHFKEKQLQVKQVALKTDWMTLPGGTVELDIKNNVKTVTVSSTVGWTATSDDNWIIIEPSSGNAGTTKVRITSTLNEDKIASGTITFDSSEEGHFKEKKLTVRQTILERDWITLPEEAVKLNINSNSKTVTINSRVDWFATPDDNWIVIEPSKGHSGKTEVKITSRLNENKETSGTITFDSSQEGHFKEKKLTVNTVLSTTVSNTHINVSVKDPQESTTVMTAFGWKIESCPEWLTAAPLQGSGTMEIKLSLKSLLYDCHEEGEIIIVDDNLDRVSVKVSHMKYFDEAFAQVLQNKGYIQDASRIDLNIVKEIEALEINKAGLTNLTGIDFFKSLKELNCSYNDLRNLDISSNTNLTHLTCNYNINLCHLDVSNNVNLSYLHCSETGLSNLNVSNNVNLLFLLCDNYYLRNLDVSKNTNLEELYCRFCQLTKLDVSKNINLTTLDCAGNPLATLDVSKNINLRTLKCYKTQLTNLDISKNTNLEALWCMDTKLTSLNISNNINLEYLDCYDNAQLKDLVCDKNINLMSLFCYNTQLTNLDVSKNIKLRVLDCSGNPLTNLDVSKNTWLYQLDCHNTLLTNLDISKNTSLRHLCCKENPGNGSKFPVKAWFSNYSIPNTLNIDAKSWEYNGNTIAIDFYK